MQIEVTRSKAPHTKPDPKNYGFGKFFSDHMFLADYSDLLKWHAPRVVPYQTFQIDPGAAVLHYGQALFEGMKAFKGADGKVRVFRPKMNWERLKAGAERLCMQAPDYDLFWQGIKTLIKTDLDWVPASPNTALYLRPTLIGTEAFLGVRPSENYLFYVIMSPVGSYYGNSADPVKIWVEPTYSRSGPGGMGNVKAGGNYASSLKAALEAKKNGYAQVLWLDACQKKFIEEVGTMNVFFKIKGKVVTPPLAGTILPGVTRASAIELLKELGIPLEERPLSLDEVIKAYKAGELEEAFGTGTAAAISPIGSLGTTINGEPFTMTINGGKNGPVATQLYQLFGDIYYSRTPDTRGWLVDIDQ